MIAFGYGVALGPLCSEHLERERAWRNNYFINIWCRQVGLISDIEQKAWFERQSKDPTIKMYAIYSKNPSIDYPKENDFIGVCGLTSIDHVNRRAEFSLYIGLEYQMNGFGKRALKTLLKHGFDDLNLNLIWGETFDGNRASVTFEQLGFKKEGTRREFYFKNGRYIDAHLYSVKNEEVVWTG